MKIQYSIINTINRWFYNLVKYQYLKIYIFLKTIWIIGDPDIWTLDNWSSTVITMREIRPNLSGVQFGLLISYVYVLEKQRGDLIQHAVNRKSSTWTITWVCGYEYLETKPGMYPGIGTVGDCRPLGV